MLLKQDNITGLIFQSDNRMNVNQNMDVHLPSERVEIEQSIKTFLDHDPDPKLTKIRGEIKGEKYLRLGIFQNLLCYKKLLCQMQIKGFCEMEMREEPMVLKKVRSYLDSNPKVSSNPDSYL